MLITQRGMRLCHALAATALGLTVMLATAGESGGASQPEWLQLRGTAALEAAPCPPDSSVAFGELDERELEAARVGEFDVFGSQPAPLRTPVDWADDPLGAHRYRQNLHKLRFLNPLLASHARSGDLDDLDHALDLGTDWVRSNRRGRPGTPVEAWSDKVVGDRVPHISYLVRAAACRELLTAARARLLLRSIEEHGRVLADPGNYVPDNHGLFVDLGLLRLTRFFPFTGAAARWEELARERYEQTLRGRLIGGVWLEHSSAYQLLAIRSLEDFLRVHGDDAELEGLLARMREAASWFVRPDGEIAQFGDSDLVPVPAWIGAEQPLGQGLAAYRDAGFAFVRATGADGEPGYLAVTAGFHNLTHKHADELSFELFDRGLPLVTDTGLYHKDPGPQRDFVLSSQAHSTLTADGLGFPIDDPDLAYGSGIVAAGDGEGWYAIEATNPLIRSQGVRHHRLFLYRPGESLVIVDDLEADFEHAYTRYLHFGPRVRVEQRAGAGLELRGPGFEGSVATGPAGVGTVTSVVRGQRDPLQGFTAPSFRRFRPRWTAALADGGAGELRVTSIDLDEARAQAPQATRRAGVTTLALKDGDGDTERLVITRRGGRLLVEPG